jgi:Holliday junction resolvasome RuvABC DNA-binding subunit
MNKMLATEKVNLQRIITDNEGIEYSIKVSRDEYEEYQEEIYHLDTRKDNLKNYGCEEVPQNIV